MSHYRGLQFVKQWNVNNVPHARTFPRVLVNMVSDRLIILSKRVVTPIFPDHPMYFQCDWQGKVDWRGTTHHTKLTTYIRNMHSDTLEDADEDTRYKYWTGVNTEKSGFIMPSRQELCDELRDKSESCCAEVGNTYTHTRLTRSRSRKFRS